MIAPSAPILLPLAAHVELRLLAAVAAERLKGGVLLEDACEGLGLLHWDVVLEEVHR
jgi:hypothetical protein